MKRLSHIILFIGCILFGAVPSTVAADKPYLSIGYIPFWSYGCYETLDYDALTHLNIAFCNPNASGDLSTGIPDANLNAIIKKAHDNDVKVLASLGGAGYFANYLNLTSAANREAFCNKIIAYVKNYGLDGIDLDVEGDAEAAFWGANYEAWVATLSEKCKDNGLLFTTAVGQWYADKITTKTFTYFDFITVMEYHRKVGDYPQSINYYANRGISAEKLVLGIPFFGHRVGGGEASYSSFMQDNPDSWYMNSLNGNTWHNVKDITDIAILAKNYGGVMIWELSQDVSGEYSLLKAVKSGLYGDGSMPQITKPVTNVSISPAASEVMEIKYLQLTASLSPEDATLKSITWESSDKSIATVDSKGSVRGISVGTVSITATSLEGKKGTATVNVISNPNKGVGNFPNIYAIIGQFSGKAMEIKDRSTQAGAEVQQYELETNDNDHQRWLFEYVSGDIYYIKSKSTGLYLTYMEGTGAASGDGTTVAIQESRKNTGKANTQQWEIVEVEDGYYSIKSMVNLKQGLDVNCPNWPTPCPDPNNGVKIHTWEYYADNSSQKWELKVLEYTGIEEIYMQPVSIFPNPTYGIITVQLNTPSGCYDLYSISGNMLKSGNLSQQSNEIDIADLNQGIYILKIQEGDNIYYDKIVKR